MFLPSKFQFKYIFWSFTVVLVFLVFKNVFVYLSLFSAQNLVFSYRKTDSINDLKKENVQLTLEINRLRSLEEENTRLKKALNITETSRAGLIYARIVGFSPSVWRRIAYIGIGRTQGLHEESLAINEEGFLVGKVLEVKKGYTRVGLLNDPYFSLPVCIEDKGMGLLQGTLRGNLKLRYIEEGQKVKEKDCVWLTCKNTSFPIHVGRVSAVKKKDDDFFLDVEVVPSAQIHSLREVFLLK